MGGTKALKTSFKERHRTIYDAARAVRTTFRNSKKIKATARSERAVHAEQVSASAPISKLYIPSGPKRINLVFSFFTESAISNESKDDMLALATKFSVDHKYDLRIVVRNHLPNPKVYIDFLSSKKLTPPASYSFYTDSSERVSSPVYRLDVTDNDVFFTEHELSKLKGWIRDEK